MIVTLHRGHQYQQDHQIFHLPGDASAKSVKYLTKDVIIN